MSDRIKEHEGEFDTSPIGPISEDAIKNYGKASHQENISPYETAISALRQGDTRLSQEHSENFDNQGLSKNEKSVVRAVDPNRLDPALRSERCAELPTDQFEEISEAINRARKNE